MCAHAYSTCAKDGYGDEVEDEDEEDHVQACSFSTPTGVPR